MDVKAIADLANLTLNPEEEKIFTPQFTETLSTVNLINEIDTSEVAGTFQVTGLSNVTRPDEIDKNRILPIKTVLSQAKMTHRQYFVVPQVIDYE